MAHCVGRDRGEEMGALTCGVKGLILDPLLDKIPLNNI